MSGEGRRIRRQPLFRWVRRLAWVVVPVAVIGEAGHHLLDAFGQALAHHFFHVLFAGVAAAAFIVYVAVDVHRHGWPEFSWRGTRRGPEGPSSVR